MLAFLKPSRRRLSAASLSFRMPGQDCAVTDLTKTFDLPRGNRSTPNCRPRRRAAKARGAVPAGQGFVFANLLCPQYSVPEALCGSVRPSADAAAPHGESQATISQPSFLRQRALFAAAMLTQAPLPRGEAWP